MFKTVSATSSPLMSIYMTSNPQLLSHGCKPSSQTPSMAALRCHSGTTNAFVLARKNNSRTVIRASMESSSSYESKASSNSVQVTNKVNKVYEDRNIGILCYTDCNGELVCEGLDEGPRLTWQDMEKLSKEKKMKAEEDLRQRIPTIAGVMDWSKLHASVSMGKN